MKTTGEKIRDLRLNLGLTQAELAEMTGITVRSITNYETDAATPRRLQLRKKLFHFSDSKAGRNKNAGE